MGVTVADEQDRPVPLAELERLATDVLADLDVPGRMDVTLMCVTAQSMTGLRERYLGGHGPTDVLAFPIDPPDDAPLEVSDGMPGMLGDVVVCPEVAERQAAAHGHSLRAELELLVVHGLLHLLGHDHAGEEERRVMFALTERLLADHRAPAEARS